MQELRQAIRRLSQNLGFTATAIITLALGVGASTAIFTVLDSVVLEPLAYHESGRLVTLWETVQILGTDADGPNPRHVGVWRERATSYEPSGIALFRHATSGFSVGSDHPLNVGTVIATANLFDVLQTPPLLGRTFAAGDDIEGNDGVAILTNAAWKNRFGADPHIVGMNFRLGGRRRTVIGVLPDGFHFPNRNALSPFRSKQAPINVAEPSIFVPAAMKLDSFSWNGEYGNWVALARLKPGVALAAAQAELTGLISTIEQQTPPNQRFGRPGMLGAYVQPMKEAVVSKAATGLWLLMGAVAGLMLIACLNLANAQLARALARQREASLRAALGASRWCLIRDALLENLILAVAGGGLGVVLGNMALDLFRRQSPVDLPRLAEVRLDGTVLAFAIALIAGSAMLFGLLPAWSLSRAQPQAALQQGGRSVGRRGGHRLHAALIGLQVFGGVTLLLITGLFVKNLLHLLNQERGFEASRVAFAQVTLSGDAYESAAARAAFIDSALTGLRAIPGAQAVGFVSAMPLEGESWVDAVERPDRPQEAGQMINLRWASAGYFEAMGQKLVAGRFFEGGDRDIKRTVLSEGLAARLFPEGEAVGRQVRVQGENYTIAGIVGDSQTSSLKAPPTNFVYVHYAGRTPARLTFMARGGQPADALAAQMREAIWKLAGDATIARAGSLDAQLRDSLAPERFQTFVLVSFGVSALLLAMLGIYGILSYSVTVRRQEIGVRMALGATRGAVYRETFREAAGPVAAGLVAGMLASAAASRLTGQLLYAVKQVDLSLMAGVVVLFVLAALLAAFVPARRAARVDPMESLRSV